jgi:cytoskeletal protein CcmA (bactofilin family)
MDGPSGVISVSERTGCVVIGSDMTFKGTIRNCRQIDIYGYVEGEIAAGSMTIHEGGQLQGQANVGAANVRGELQGEIVVDGLMTIFATGSVHGHVTYGRLAMEPGAELSAQLRNVPPRLVGDFEIGVQRGRNVRITTDDVTAIDPDNTASELTFTVSDALHGRVVVTGATNGASNRFTQADLLGGRVVFIHDGSAGAGASFGVVVTDTSGGQSGAPQTVKVVVTD